MRRSNSSPLMAPRGPAPLSLSKLLGAAGTCRGKDCDGPVLLGRIQGPRVPSAPSEEDKVSATRPLMGRLVAAGSSSSIAPRWSSWVRGKLLGAGSYGKVYKAMDSEATQIFAVKEVPLDSALSKARDRLDNELKICQRLRHRNIVSYLGHDYREQALFIYLEYVPGGSMEAFLREFGPLEGDALRKAALETLLGLDYLHTLSPPVVHRDLKGANLLVGSGMEVKLADFGCSRCCDDTTSFSTLGSVPWMATEVIAQVEGYGRGADIWSFGCTVIEMATGEKPWGDGALNNLLFALNRIANSDETPPLPQRAPPECRDLIARCTQRSQHARPATTWLLKHDFLSPSSGKSLARDRIHNLPTW
mmetsp:Transcript_102516/g.287338  ORF Transcript_102516/g.287338 Transcript_102516/m.287338 type:complete len:362 (+) Transcript_102516:52-1137(+)